MVAPHGELAIDATGSTPTFEGELHLRAVVVQARHGGEVLLREARRRLAHRDEAFVLAGLPTTSTLHIEAGDFVLAPCPARVKILALVPTAGPCAPCRLERGTEPTSSATFGAREDLRVDGDRRRPPSSGNAQSSQFHDDATHGALRWAGSSSMRCGITGWSGPSRSTVGDAEQAASNQSDRRLR